MIGIFDSGIGGLSVFREIRALLPDQSYIYYADSANCPYGEKSREFIIDRAEHITEALARDGAEIIVVACNTATAAAISTLRGRYSDASDPAVRDRVLRITCGRRDHLKFIGMEPAVKPAAAITRSGVVGVLATAGTLGGMKYRSVCEQFAKGVTVREHVGQGFVELVEQGITDGRETEETVRRSLQPLLDAGADIIVLGCTHYPFLKDVLSRIAGPGVTIIDPAPAVARHLAEVMEKEGIPPSDRTLPEIRLYSSGDAGKLQALYRKLIG